MHYLHGISNLTHWEIGYGVWIIADGFNELGYFFDFLWWPPFAGKDQGGPVGVDLRERLA